MQNTEYCLPKDQSVNVARRNSFYCDNHTKYVIALCGQNWDFSVELCGGYADHLALRDQCRCFNMPPPVNSIDLHHFFLWCTTIKLVVYFGALTWKQIIYNWYFLRKYAHFHFFFLRYCYQGIVLCSAVLMLPRIEIFSWWDVTHVTRVHHIFGFPYLNFVYAWHDFRFTVRKSRSRRCGEKDCPFPCPESNRAD